MSEFDKEAEREKLREKYEQDRQKRETTEKMSELLLQGATMTNAHCSECSDPIFRYDGQEFCATCERAVDRDTAESEDGQGAGAVEVTSPEEDVRVSFGGDDGVDPEGGDTTGADTETDEPSSGVETATADGETARNPSPATGANRSSADQHTPRKVPGLEPEGTEDLQQAKASLVRTLVRFSEAAETTSDPVAARENLVAAREAAETLAALRR